MIPQRSQPANDANANLTPLLFGDENRGNSVAKFLETLGETILLAVPTIRTLEQATQLHRQSQLLGQQRLDAATSRLEDQQRETNERLTRLEQNTGSVQKELAKHAAVSSAAHGRLETVAFNLEQVRTLLGTLAQKQEQLSNDFIERQVTDHLYKEFANLQFALERLSSDGKTDLKTELSATAEAIGDFLTESGFRVINPKPGDSFEPREHQPIKVIPADGDHWAGRVAETFNPGLSRKDRVIQQARVAVFKANGS